MADFFGAYGTMVSHHGAWSDTMVNVFVGAGQELEQVPASTFELEQVKGWSRTELEQIRVGADQS